MTRSLLFRSTFSSGSVWPLAVLLATTACGSTPTPSHPNAPSSGGRDEISRLLPLTDGTVYSYATRSDGSNDTGLLVIEVVRRSDSLVELKSGARRQQLKLVPEGVAHSGGGFLLKRPLVTGAQFRGEFGTVTVSRVGIAITVPAGRFTDCLETVEARVTGDTTQVSTKVFCPEVGIVSLHTEAESGDQVMSDWAELKASGHRVAF